MYARLSVKTASHGEPRGGAIQSTFRTLALLAIVLWSLYPVVWLLGTEGFNAVGSTLEAFLFLILDFFAKIGFGFLLLTNRQALGEAVGRNQAYTNKVR
jgi:bacteriorhodopsin